MKSHRWIIQAAIVLTLICKSLQLEKFISFGDDEALLYYYKEALRGNLIAASQNKRITIEHGGTCEEQADFCIHNIGDVAINTELTSMIPCSLQVSCHTQTCVTTDSSVYTNVAERDSRENLILGQEAFMVNVPKATYLMDINTAKR